MKIKAFSQDMILEYIPPPNSRLISIGDPGDKDLVLKDGWDAILRLNFHDIDLMRYLNTPEIPEYWIKWENLQKYTVFNYGHARKIKEFLSTINSIDYLAINCHAGVSRSVGIMVALERFINNENVTCNPRNICYNKWVCAVLSETLYSMPL